MSKDTQLVPLTPEYGFFPVLPLRDVVMFPYAVSPLYVGREKSLRAVHSALKNKTPIVCLTQKTPGEEDPALEELHTVGVICQLTHVVTLRDGTLKVVLQGEGRFVLESYVPRDDLIYAKGQPVYDVSPEESDDTQEIEGLRRAVLSAFETMLRVSKKPEDEQLLDTLKKSQELGKITDCVAAAAAFPPEQKQNLLETFEASKRAEMLLNFLHQEIENIQAEIRVSSRLKAQVEKTQRQYYLSEKLKAIQKELGEEGEDGKDDIAQLEKKIAETKLSKEAREKAESELKKRKMMSPMSAEATVSRAYLEWLLGVPWSNAKQKRVVLDKAQEILDEHHYGSPKVKERILEHIAVVARLQKPKGDVLCFVGPPGVGKTALGESVALAMNRPFVRVALGGVNSEAEIRGHRRTYVGAMPGKIMQAMKKAGAKNPVMLLDEIDKLGTGSWQGDPQAALLEVLDPKQNKAFMDHYLDVEYDLSNVLFITTANTLDPARITKPLLDRLDVVWLSGYTEEEKLAIAKKHLAPKQKKAHGLKDQELDIQDEAIIQLIRTYAREAGVRQLEREIAKLCRKAVRQIMSGSKHALTINKENLQEFAGIPRYHYGEIHTEDLPGVTTGLAWSESGGELLSIEAVLVSPGKGNVITTGKLGDVMEESIKVASSLIRSRAPRYGIPADVFEKYDIHVHVPEGSIPKDGPSAGVGMCTSIVSLLTKNPVKRDVAMTGEISLKGKVMIIGGLKEKLLAAYRGGVAKVLIPWDNIKDLEDVPETVKAKIQIVPVHTLDEVLEHALVRPLSAVEEEAFLPAATKPAHPPVAQTTN